MATITYASVWHYNSGDNTLEFYANASVEVTENEGVINEFNINTSNPTFTIKNLDSNGFSDLKILGEYSTEDSIDCAEFYANSSEVTITDAIPESGTIEVNGEGVTFIFDTESDVNVKVTGVISGITTGNGNDTIEIAALDNYNEGDGTDVAIDPGNGFNTIVIDNDPESKGTFINIKNFNVTNDTIELTTPYTDGSIAEDENGNGLQIGNVIISALGSIDYLTPETVAEVKINNNNTPTTIGDLVNGEGGGGSDKSWFEDQTESIPTWVYGDKDAYEDGDSDAYAIKLSGTGLSTFSSDFFTNYKDGKTFELTAEMLSNMKEGDEGTDVTIEYKDETAGTYSDTITIATADSSTALASATWKAGAEESPTAYYYLPAGTNSPGFQIEDTTITKYDPTLDTSLNTFNLTGFATNLAVDATFLDSYFEVEGNTVKLKQAFTADQLYNNDTGISLNNVGGANYYVFDGSDVPAAATYTNVNYTYSGNVITYRKSGTEAGCTVTVTNISVSSASSGLETILTLSGVKAATTVITKELDNVATLSEITIDSSWIDTTDVSPKPITITSVDNTPVSVTFNDSFNAVVASDYISIIANGTIDATVKVNNGKELSGLTLGSGTNNVTLGSGASISALTASSGTNTFTLEGTSYSLAFAGTASTSTTFIIPESVTGTVMYDKDTHYYFQCGDIQITFANDEDYKSVQLQKGERGTAKTLFSWVNDPVWSIDNNSLVLKTPDGTTEIVTITGYNAGAENPVDLLTNNTGNNTITFPAALIGTDEITITKGTTVQDAYTFDFSAGEAKVNFNFANGIIQSTSDNGYTITIPKTASGTTVSLTGNVGNTVTVNSTGNTITTGSGNDNITVNENNNTITSGSGNDTITLADSVNVTITDFDANDTLVLPSETEINYKKVFWNQNANTLTINDNIVLKLEGVTSTDTDAFLSTYGGLTVNNGTESKQLREWCIKSSGYNWEITNDTVICLEDSQDLAIITFTGITGDITFGTGGNTTLTADNADAYITVDSDTNEENALVYTFTLAPELLAVLEGENCKKISLDKGQLISESDIAKFGKPEGVTESEEIPAGGKWIVDTTKQTANLYSAGNTEGYNIADETISYVKSTDSGVATQIVSLTGINTAANADTFASATLQDNTVTIPNNAVATTQMTVTAAEDHTVKFTTAANVLVNSSSTTVDVSAAENSTVEVAADVNTVTISASDTKADTFKFNVSGEATKSHTISGLDNNDKLYFDTYGELTVADKAITVTNGAVTTTINVNTNDSNLANMYNVEVYNGETKAGTLGDLVDPVCFAVNKNVVTYGRQNSNVYATITFVGVTDAVTFTDGEKTVTLTSENAAQYITMAEVKSGEPETVTGYTFDLNPKLLAVLKDTAMSCSAISITKGTETELTAEFLSPTGLTTSEISRTIEADGEWIVDTTEHKANLYGAGTTEGYVLAKDNISYNKDAGVTSKVVVSLTGIKDTATQDIFASATLEGTTVTIPNDAVATTQMTVTAAENHTVKFTTAANVLVNSSSTTVDISAAASSTVEVAADVNTVTISASDTNADTFKFNVSGEANKSHTISGFNNNDKLYFDTYGELTVAGKAITVTNGAVTTTIKVNTNDSNLANMYGVKVYKNNAEIDTLGNIVDPLVWTIYGNSAIYGRKTGSDTALITISNLNLENVTEITDAQIAVSGNETDGYVFTIANSLIPTDATKTVSFTPSTENKIYANATLALATPADAGESIAESWAVDANAKTVTYTSASSKQGPLVSVDKKTISYVADNVTAQTLTISGLQGTLTDGTAKPEGVTLIKETANEAATITGASVTKGLVGTLGDEDKVTISAGFKLYFGADFTDADKSVTSDAGWKLNDTDAVYNTGSSTAGYKLNAAKNEISFNSVKKTGEDVITISGLKNASSQTPTQEELNTGLPFTTNTVNISSDLLNGDAITIDGADYQYQLGKAQNVTIKSKNTKIIGAETGANIFNVDTSITQLADGEYINFTGGAGTNEFNISGISAEGTGKIELVGNATAVDTFKIANSNNITITAGANAEDTLQFEGNVTAQITDFSAKDILKFTNEVKLASFKDGVLTFTEKTSDNNIALTIGDADTNLGTYGQMMVYNGPNDSEGRRLITMANSWSSVSSGVWQYGTSESSALFTITGFAAGVTTVDGSDGTILSGVSIANSELTISDATVLGTSGGVTLANATGNTNPYKFASLGSNIYNTLKDYRWNTVSSGENYQVALYSKGDTVSYNLINDDTVIALGFNTTQADFLLDGVSSNASKAFDTPTSGTVTIVSGASSATNAVTISANDTYTVVFDGKQNVAIGALASNKAITGSNEADTISFIEKGVTLTGKATIDGGKGADIFNISNITLSGDDAKLTVAGGEGTDTFSIGDVTGIYFDASNDSDFISVGGGSANTIVSGSTDSDTITFGGTGAGVFISGFDSNDAFSFAESVTGNFSDTVMTLTSGGKDFTITLGSALNATLYDNVKVYVGSTAETLGNIIDPYQWSSIAADKAQYGRASGGIFTITGGNFATTVGADPVATITGATVGGGYVTISSAELLGGATNIGSKIILETAASGIAYNFALAENVTASTASAMWNTTAAAEGSTATISLYDSGTTVTYTAEAATITSAFAEDAEASLVLQGVASTGAVGLSLPENDKFTIASNLINSATQITIATNDGYDLTFGAAAKVLINDFESGTKVTGSSNADTISFGSLTIEGGAATLDAGDGADLITVSGVTFSTSGGLFVDGGAGSDTITISDITAAGALTVSGGEGKDYFNVSGSKGVSLVSGENDSDTFVLGGATGVFISSLDTTDAISFTDNSVTATVSGAEGKEILFTAGNATVTVGVENAASAFYGVNIKYNSGESTTSLGDLVDPRVWATVGSADYVKYGRQSLEGDGFTITGGNFADTIGENPVATITGATVGGEYVTIGSSALIGDGLTISGGNYKFALGKDATTGSFAATWDTNSSDSTASYIAAGMATYGTAGEEDKQVTLAAPAASFVLEGVAETALSKFTTIATDGAVTIPSDASSAENAVTISTNDTYAVVFDGKQNVAIGALATGKAITGSDKADTISFTEDGVTLTGAATIDGGADADIFNISNITLSGDAKLTVLGGAGADSINVTGINGALTVVGGAEADVFTLTNSTINVDASEGKDTINITGGASTITSGPNDSDTFIFGDSAAGVFISGLDTTDAISLSGEVTGTLSGEKDFILTVGSAAITVNTDAASISNLYNVQVYQGNEERPVNLGDVIDPYIWSSVTGGVQYGRREAIAKGDGDFTILGGGFTVEDNTVEVVSVEGSTVKITDTTSFSVPTLSSAVFGGDVATLNVKTDGKFAFAELGEQSTITTVDLWDLGSTTASLYASGATVNYAVESGTIISAAFDGDATAGLILEGLKSDGVKVDNFTAPVSNAFTVKGDLVDGSKAVTISANTGYDLTFESATNMLISTLPGGHKVVGSAEEDTITFGTQEISGAATVDAGNGENAITVSGVTFKDSGALFVAGGESSDTITVSNITGSGKLTVVGGKGEDVFNVDKSTGVSLVSGGADSDTFVLSNGSSVYISGFDSTDAISLSTAVTAGQAKFDSTTKNIVFGEQATINIGNTAATDLYKVNVAHGDTSSMLGDMIDPYIWQTVESGVITWARGTATTDALFTISGLNPTITVEEGTIDEIKFADDNTVSIISADVLTQSNVTLSNAEGQNYKLAVAENLKIDPVENWVVQDTVASYIQDEITFTVEDDNSTVITASLPAGTMVFKGVVSNVTNTAFNYVSDVASATIGSAAIGNTQITVSTGAKNEINFASAANVMLADSNTSIIGSSGADTLEISADLTALGSVVLDGGAGADTFKVTDLEVSEGTINLIGGADADTFEITNSSNINVDASDGADVITIDSSTNISILSGSDDADTIKLGTFTTDAIITVNGLSETDAISVSSAISTGGIDEDNANTIILGGGEDSSIKIVAEGVPSLSTIYDMKVTDSNGTRNLGDIIDPYIWQTVESGGITWARGTDTTDALFTITGLKVEDITEPATIEGLTVTANGVSITSAELLNSQNIVLTNTEGNDYKLYIANTVKQSLEEAEVVNVGDSPTITAKYIPDNTTFTYAGTGSTILAPNFPAGSVVISNLNTVLAFESEVITVTADAINSDTEIGVAFNAGDAPEVVFGDAAKFKVDTFAVVSEDTPNKVTGSSEADTITVTGNVATSKQAEISGGAGDDSINITGLTVGGANNKTTGISISGGAGDDTIIVDAVAGNPSGRNSIVIDGDGGEDDAGKDVIVVTGSSHISINSGEADSDTFVLSGTNAISVGGLDSTDVISLASAVTTSDASISTDEIDGTLKLGTNTIYLEGVSDADGMASLYGITVYNGSADATIALGDLVDPMKWSVGKEEEEEVTGTFMYGRTNTDTGLISIGSGLNANVTAAQLDSVTSNGVVTIQASMLNTNSVEFTAEEGYSVTLASGAQNSLAAAWVNLDADDTTTYAYKLAGNTTYTIESGENGSTIVATDAREIAVQLKGLAAIPTAAPSNNALTIAQNAIPESNGEIDIESGTGYAFTFNSSSSKGAYVSVGAGLSSISVSGAAGADSLVAGEGTSNVSLFGGAGNDTLVTDVNGNTLAGGAGADVFVLGGESVTSLTISDADSLDSIIILNVSDDLTSGTIENGVLTIGGKTITLGNVTGDNASAMYGLKVYTGETDTGTLLQDLVDAIGWNIDGTTATYGRKYGNETGLISVSELNTLDSSKDIADYISLTAAGANSTINYVEITNKDILDSLKTAALTFSSNNTSYSAANTQITVASGIPQYSYTDAAWAYSESVLSYTTYDEQPGYDIADGGQSISYNVNKHDESSFSVSGLYIPTWSDTMSATGVEGITLASVTADTGTLTFESTTYFGAADISIKGTEEYDLTLNLTNADSYVQGTAERTWKASGSDAVYYNDTVAAGYSLVADQNYIQYQEPKEEAPIVTLTGMGAMADSLISASVVSGANINLNSALLASVTANQVSLKAAGENAAYKLVLDPDAKYSTSNASWSVPSGGTAIYNEAATTAGWNANDSLIISKIDAAGGDVVSITGLDSSVKLRSGKINSLTYDEDTSTFTFGSKVLAEQNVSITSANSSTYNISLAADVATVGNRESAFWTSADSIANYYNENAAKQVSTAGYTTVTGGITYSEEDASKATATYTIAGLSAKATVKNDKISGFTVGKNDSLKIAANLIGNNGATITAAPENAVVQLGGRAKLYASLSSAIQLIGSSGADSLYNIGTASISIDGGSGNDVIVAGNKGDYVSGGKGNDVISLGSGADTLEYQGGRDSVYGYNSADSIGMGTAAVKSWSYSNNNLTLNIGSGSLTFNGTPSITVGEDIYKENFLYNSSKTEVTIGASAPSALTYANYSIAGGTASIVNASGLKNAVSITAGSAAASILGTAKNDYLTGGTGADTLNGGKGNDTLRTGGGADSLYGDAGKDLFIIDSINGGGTVTIADYAAKQDAISIGGGASITNALKDEEDITLALSNNTSVKVGGGNGKVISVNGVNTIFESGAFMNDKKTSVTLVSGSSYDAPSTMVTIDGSGNSTAMNITGSAKANSIIGGRGADTLNGGKGNDTLYGGAGKDVFAYATGEGKDVVADFVATEDSISLSGGVADLTKSSLSSDGLILTVKNQDVKVISSSSLADTAVSINGTGYKFGNNMMFNSDSTAVSLFSAFKGELDANSYNKLATIDGASHSVSSAMTVNGNGLANVIKGGKGADSLNGGAGADTIDGGKGNDIIIGGAGDDSLNGGDGKDTFVYEIGDGKDKIADYKAGQDKLQIGAELASIKVYTSGSNTLVDVGTTTGAITLENFSSGKLSIVDSTGKTTTKTVAKWNTDTASTSSDVFDLFEDNNFINDVPQIDDVSTITDSKYAVGDVKSDNLDSLTQNQDFITYGEDDKK